MGDSGRGTNDYSDKDGHFRRKDSAFRNWISNEPNSEFPPEKGRYVLYANYGCPWAHRTILVRALKNLEDIVQVVMTDFDLTENGWLFTGKNGSADRDPLYGFAGLKQLYLKADPEYEGRYLVPTLWDRKNETIVNNESSEVIRMFYSVFDDLIPTDFRESTKGSKGLYPEHLREDINAMNDWVYNTINNGVYKCGFATSQEAYDANIYPLFDSLDRIEAHLSDAQACRGGPFLFGEHLTEADIRLYPTIARFDSAYHTIFKCNLKMIRHDYPRISRWFRRIYWNASNIPKGEVFKNTTVFDVHRFGYTNAIRRQNKIAVPVAPRGPKTDIYPWTEDDEDIDRGRKVAFQQGDAKVAGEGSDGTGAKDVAPELERRTTYEEQNEKWYKAAKKAEKKSGAPNVHLAL